MADDVDNLCTSEVHVKSFKHQEVSHEETFPNADGTLKIFERPRPHRWEKPHGERMPTSVDTTTTQFTTDNVGYYLRAGSYGHLMAGLIWKRRSEEVSTKGNWRNVPTWESPHVHRKSQLFLSACVDDIKMLGTRQIMGHDQLFTGADPTTGRETTQQMEGLRPNNRQRKQSARAPARELVRLRTQRNFFSNQRQRGQSFACFTQSDQHHFQQEPGPRITNCDFLYHQLHRVTATTSHTDASAPGYYRC